jgi:sec-independent protein translocase protein TatB
MFGMGFSELVIIAVVLVVAVGPRELPTLMKSLGKGLQTVKRASEELRSSVSVDALLQDDAKATRPHRVTREEPRGPAA